MTRIRADNMTGVCGRLVYSMMSKEVEEDLGRPAMVFAPHPDDETLGCGGTIMRKLEQGARVQVVFLTSGGQSHSQLMTEEKMVSIREAEGLAVCQALGIDRQDVRFLGLSDGKLEKQIGAGIEAVESLLRKHSPEEVFVTSGREPSGDHRAANEIVRRAILHNSQTTTVWEYPIWWWNQWPWLSLDRTAIRHPNAGVLAVWKGLPSISQMRGFGVLVDISTVLDRKKAALALYISQMTRFSGDEKWPILNDSGAGRFLPLLLQSHELFKRYPLPVPDDRR